MSEELKPGGGKSEGLSAHLRAARNWEELAQELKKIKATRRDMVPILEELVRGGMEREWASELVVRTFHIAGIVSDAEMLEALRQLGVEE
jgi:hypothetical protein